jgi:hypothetical protein
MNEFNIFNVLEIGDLHTGKTSFIEQYSTFERYYFIGDEIYYYLKDIESKEMKFRIRLWETTIFNINIVLSYLMKHMHLLIFIYDITSYSSYLYIRRIIKSIDKTAKIIVGNKIYINENRCVMFGEGKEFAKKYNANYFEI